MEKKLYQCPYKRAAKCNMEYPCKDCEDFKPMSNDFAIYSGKMSFLQFFLEALIYATDSNNWKNTQKLELVAVEPEKKLHIIPNNPESGNTRMFISSRYCEKCYPNGAYSNEAVLKYFKVIPDVIICCACGHEQKITK